MGEIRVEKIKVLTGGNIWAYRPVLEIRANIGKYETLPSNKIEGFTERLVATIPSLWTHRCSEGRPGGFLERLRLGTYMGHIVEHIILELQSLAGQDVGFGRTRQTGRYAEYQIVVDFKDPEAGKLASYLAIELAEKLAENQTLGFDLKERIEEIRETAESHVLGPSTQAIVDAARARGIPWMRLNDQSLVQLGHGKFARRIQAAETSYTPNIGVEIASDKDLTKALLHKVGVPVPAGEVVNNADDAWRVAQELDGPVVVKPFAGNQGKAVSVNLTTQEQVRQAVAIAQEHSEEVIVERFIEGEDCRLLVVDGKLVAAAQRRPAQVVSDGLHTVRELVEMVNEDPRRGSGHGTALTKIRLDAVALLTLEKQGLGWDSIPPAGQVVYLRDNSNLSTGGTAVDLTDDVHPDNAALAVLAAMTIGLDIAGVDIVCKSIKRPLQEQGGAVVEINAAPGLRMHVHPSEGKPRPVGEAIVDMLFPPGSQARVPLIAVTGTNGKTTVTRMIAHIYSTMQKYIGMTTTDGIYFGGVRRVKGDSAGPRSAESVLQHPMVEVAVLETARGGILRSGLAWDRSLVSVVLNIAADHMGLEGVDSLERLARVKRVIVEGVSKDGYGVLNADDPRVADMAEYCPGKVIYFGMDYSSRNLTMHLAAGGRAVYFWDGRILLAEGSSETLLMRAADIPATHGGVIPFQISNALAAAAATWGAGVPIEQIRLGLRTFQTDDKTAPGRFNIFEVGRARVIVDYGHNPHALGAMSEAIKLMKPRRCIGVVAAPGDRRDADIQDLAVIAANTFDEIIVREDDDPRGREPGEVATLISETIKRTNPNVPVHHIYNETEAADRAIRMLGPGDLAIIFVDKVDDTLDQVRRAGKTIAVEQSEGFYVPMPDASRAGQRNRIEALAGVPSQELYHRQRPEAEGGNGVEDVMRDA
jgi:cyanophycin synthetase